MRPCPGHVAIMSRLRVACGWGYVGFMLGILSGESDTLGLGAGLQRRGACVGPCRTSFVTLPARGTGQILSL